MILHKNTEFDSNLSRLFHYIAKSRKVNSAKQRGNRLEYAILCAKFHQIAVLRIFDPAASVSVSRFLPYIILLRLTLRAPHVCHRERIFADSKIDLPHAIRHMVLPFRFMLIARPRILREDLI